jgi:coenzyme PQQ synthesis protein D (PqqD)
MTSSLRPRNIQGDRITIQDVETETLIYDERSHKAWCLNRSSASIWRLCDGQHTVAQIAALAAVDMGSPVSEDLVLLTLEVLREKDLLEPQTAMLLPQGLSRRQMIGRAGLAAAALLPVIAALTAPPASAQSGSTGTGDSVSGGYKEP